MKTLIIVDMQNDFIDGALANPAAAAIVEPMAEYIKNFEGDILFTRDTHRENYLNTQEGKNLPIKHCICNTKGWELEKSLWQTAYESWQHDRGCSYATAVNKDSFGDVSELVGHIDYNTDEIYICGTCTDICVVSIALNLKARFPDIKMYCLKDLCAGVTSESHQAALTVMKMCQIEVI